MFYVEEFITTHLATFNKKMPCFRSVGKISTNKFFRVLFVYTQTYTYTHTHTHTHIYIYIYIYVTCLWYVTTNSAGSRT
jgi:hypothetical protein